jgi:hypothetical protein
MDTQTGRPVTLAPNGLVTSPHSVASAAGLDVLRAGGSAVDAAIATSAALSVLYPHMTSIGGGTALQRRDQVGVALGHTGPAFLQENAELEIDAPGVILRELLERIDALQPDIGIDLHMVVQPWAIAVSSDAPARLYTSSTVNPGFTAETRFM